MRISTRQIQQLGVDSILGQQERLSRTQQQVATGKRILLPSDDPVATSQLLQLRQSVETTTQYQANADAAINRLSLEEGVLTSVTEILQSVRVLAVQGNNASQTNETRGYMATEIRQRLEELLGLANTRDGTGDYLFSGTKGSTPPFVRNGPSDYSYEGDQTQRYLQIGAGRKVADGDAGSSVFQFIRTGNGTFMTEPGAGNTGTGIITSAEVSGSFSPDDYVVSFTNFRLEDSAANVVDPDPLVTYTATDGSGIEVTFSGAPPVYSVVDTTTGETVLPEEGTSLAVDDGSGNTFTIDFGTFYGIEDSLGNVIAAGEPFVAEEPIGFPGVALTLTGQPANGDTFTIRPSEYKDVFETLEDLADALATPVQDPAGQAQLNNAVNRALGDIDLAMENVLVVRAGVGARLNAIDSQVYVNEGYLVQAQETLSSIEDLDYAEAISRLHMQMAGLEAAQQAYIKVNGLSMFNYLK